MLNKKVGEKKFNLKVLIMKKYFHKKNNFYKKKSFIKKVKNNYSLKIL
jgi:hypothetical protein